MTDTEQIGVATTTSGSGSTDPRGRGVSLPVRELLTGRGFITGESGAGKSNTASVIVENLLERDFGLCIVDTAGEYYSLKESYELLHVGADEACDVQVTAAHGEKLAALTIEQNIPIILDLSSFVSQGDAESLLRSVAQHLLANAKTAQQRSILLLEELHEWIPEQGPKGDVGEMVVKLGKRGPKHGLGVLGISQRPAAVDTEFIRQCDWRVWHRLARNDHRNVAGRLLNRSAADAIDGLADGEAVLQCDWTAEPRRVQIHRKGTFEAEATRGLDDFKEPPLTSVSNEVVAELEAVQSTGSAQSDVEDLRAELRDHAARIEVLEAELAERPDLEQVAGEFAEALVEHVRDELGTPVDATERVNDAASAFADEPADEAGDQQTQESSSAAADTDDAVGAAFGMFDEAASQPDESSHTQAERTGSADANATDGTFDLDPAAFETDTGDGTGDAPNAAEATQCEGAVDTPGGESGSTPQWLQALTRDIQKMEGTTQEMLACYLEDGPDTPLNAHFSAGGDGDRTMAYAHNRRLRLSGFIEHAGRGRYEPALATLVREESEETLSPDAVADAVETLRTTVIDE
jgi:hypothetical protein